MAKIEDVCSQFTVCGHRGYAAKFPENTMISFQEAVKVGVDMVELDVGVSKDGVLVICHDDTLDRTSDGSGPVSSYTFKELRKFNMAARFSSDIPAQRIPAFEEFCEWFAAQKELLVNIDMKLDGGVLSDKAADLVEQYGFHDRCVFNGLNGLGIARMFDRGFFTEASPDGYYGMIHFDQLYSNQNRKLRSICLDANNDTNPQEVSRLQAMGLPVWAWGADDDWAVNNLLDCGVTLALCNNPLPCMRIARERGLRK